MKKVPGGVVFDGLTKSKRRRMRSALGRLQDDVRDMELKAVAQDGGLNRNQLLRYHEMQMQVATLERKLGAAEL